MRTAVNTDGLPGPGDVVLLHSEPDFFAVLDHHPDAGWTLIRIVKAARLGRYRTRYPGPSRPLSAWEAFTDDGPASFVQETKTVTPGEAHEFLSIEGTLEAVDLRAAQAHVR